MTIETTVKYSAKITWTTPGIVDVDQGYDAVMAANGGPNGDGAPGSAPYNLTS